MWSYEYYRPVASYLCDYSDRQDLESSVGCQKVERVVVLTSEDYRRLWDLILLVDLQTTWGHLLSKYRFQTVREASLESAGH